MNCRIHVSPVLLICSHHKHFLSSTERGQELQENRGSSGRTNADSTGIRLSETNDLRRGNGKGEGGISEDTFMLKRIHIYQTRKYLSRVAGYH